METSNTWPALLGQNENVQGEFHFPKLPDNDEITEASRALAPMP